VSSFARVPRWESASTKRPRRLPTRRYKIRSPLVFCSLKSPEERELSRWARRNCASIGSDG
jgi:hypothetical protein